jgi:hypothetical protein
MKIREHRLLLDDAMATCKEIEPTMKAVINEVLSSLPVFLHIKPEDIHVEPYGYDKRIGWDTHVVVVDGYGVYGFTDGMPSE